MKRSIFVLVVMMTCTKLSAQTLTESEISAAIKAGEARKFNHLVSDCAATAGFGEHFAAGMAGGIQRTGSYSVVLSSNAGRIAFMAAQAKRLYKPFSLESVGEDLKTPAVFVTVEPNDPKRSNKVFEVAAPIEHVVLKSKTNTESVVQPTKVEREPVEWSNLLGGKVEANRAVAWFDEAAVRELPPGDFDIVVITPNGERRCKVAAKDRTKVLPPK